MKKEKHLSEELNFISVLFEAEYEHKLLYVSEAARKSGLSYSYASKLTKRLLNKKIIVCKKPSKNLYLLLTVKGRVIGDRIAKLNEVLEL